MSLVRRLFPCRTVQPYRRIGAACDIDQVAANGILDHTGAQDVRKDRAIILPRLRIAIIPQM